MYMYVLSHHKTNRSKKKGQGHRHRHHAHHPPTATAPVSAALETEEEEEDVVVDEHEEEEEPAPVMLVGVPRVYSCGECRTHLASDMDVISRVCGWVCGGVQRRGGCHRSSIPPTNQPTNPPDPPLSQPNHNRPSRAGGGGRSSSTRW